MSLIPATITFGFNAETLAVISELAASIRSVSGATGSVSTAAVTTKAADKPAAKPADKPKTDEAADDEPETIYWFSSATKEFGTVDSEDAFKALKKKDAKTVKWTEDKYKKAVADKAAADKAAAGSDEDAPSEDDVIAAFGAYLPADLDAAEKAERRPFVLAILERFGAKKASQLPEEHRKLAINLVQRKAAGQEVDPESDEFEEFDADEDGLV